MQTQYSKDKTRRLSFRVNDALADWVERRAKELGVGPCEYARTLLFQQMAIEAQLRAIDTPVAANARATNENRKKRQ